MIYLDEYLVAADRLEESGPGFHAVASALRDMHARVVSVFTEPDSTDKLRYDASRSFILDGHLIATDLRIMIRMPSSEPDTKLSPSQKRLADGVLQYVAKWAEYGEGSWHPMPQLVPGDDDLWGRRVSIANRDISGEYVRRIHLLPEPEYLDDCADYIVAHEEQPLRFRFRCGEGIVMPMRPRMTEREIAAATHRDRGWSVDVSLTESQEDSARS